MNVNREMLAFLRKQYPVGTRIRLDSMQDPYAPVEAGTTGKLDYIDDAGQFHMNWDNGRTLALIPGVDGFTVLPPELSMTKLYTTSSQFHRYLFLNWIPPQQIAIPQQLLEQAGIDSNAEVQIACMDGAIIITGDTPLTEDELSEVVDRLRAVNDLTKHFPSELDTEEGGTGYSVIPYT